MMGSTSTSQFHQGCPATSPSDLNSPSEEVKLFGRIQMGLTDKIYPWACSSLLLSPSESVESE